jgi:pimeloyl-ACP methyl ester carboxylesterase
MVTAVANFLHKVPKWLWWLAAAIVLLAAAGYVAAGWYISSKLLKVAPQQVTYDQAVRQVAGSAYTIQGGTYDVDGLMGGIRQDGSFVGIFGQPAKLDSAAKTSVRELTSNQGLAPVKGEPISLQGNIWISDPKQALGVDYQDVRYPGPLGSMNAWLIPLQGSTTWTIAVHGIGAPRSELLRFVKPVRAAGSNMLVINYRGDAGNPAEPDGFTHLGDTEWQDLEAAVRYAKANGATNIQLYGVSLGGSIVQNYLRRSADVPKTNISKVVLDSPALDWRQLAHYRVQIQGYPAFLANPGLRVANWRAGINFDRITTFPGSIRQPTLIIHNADDHNVPQAPSKQVAAAQPNLVTFYDFGSGGHTRAWNHDPARYEQLVTEFLK